ncbi:GFA family protein [Halotalea alkalilenta]|uniref:Aldehyde-activating protein n=1 Tax=Halotalea alkalilenta TaxID=376489 RepID=A0A172YC54_9GAMM|nr:GFA family protein [Halotalea alkalilenta]ANF56798.1 aldehyde-activating protein [Halotalea alkalilenta]
MSMKMEYRGGCLCGAVQLYVMVDGHKVGACHCAMCRKWGGGPLLALENVLGLRLEGEEAVSVYASSNWAERGFCSHCGTHLFYRLKDGGHYAVPVGLLEVDDDWVLDEEIFIESQPPYYAFSNQTKRLTGEQAFAAKQP